ELTDEIIRRYFAITPPAFVTLSGTLLLPLPVFPHAESRQQASHKALRKLRYQPDGVLPWLDAPEAAPLIEQKVDWIKKEPTSPQERRQRFEKIRALNEAMWPYVAAEERRFRREMAQAQAEVHASAITQRRDYAFCLFPEAKIRSFCTQFLVEPAATAAG